MLMMVAAVIVMDIEEMVVGVLLAGSCLCSWDDDDNDDGDNGDCDSYLSGGRGGRSWS